MEYFSSLNYYNYSKVFLGCKKLNREKKYAVKVMKKEEMINKNMVGQGEHADILFHTYLFIGL